MRISPNNSVFSTAQAYFADPELAVGIRSGDTTGSLLKRMLGRVIDVQASLEQIRSSLLVHTAIFKSPAASGPQAEPPNHKKKNPQRLAKSLASQLKAANRSFTAMFEQFDRLGHDSSSARASLQEAMLAPLGGTNDGASPVSHRLSTALGIGESLRSFGFAQPDAGLLEHALTESKEEFLDFLLADEPQRQGLIPSLLSAVRQIQTELTDQLGSAKGLLLDAWA